MYQMTKLGKLLVWEQRKERHDGLLSSFQLKMLGGSWYHFCETVKVEEGLVWWGSEEILLWHDKPKGPMTHLIGNIKKEVAPVCHRTRLLQYCWLFCPRCSLVTILGARTAECTESLNHYIIHLKLMYPVCDLYFTFLNLHICINLYIHIYTKHIYKYIERIYT